MVKMGNITYNVLHRQETRVHADASESDPTPEFILAFRFSLFVTSCSDREKLGCPYL